MCQIIIITFLRYIDTCQAKRTLYNPDYYNKSRVAWYRFNRCLSHKTGLAALPVMSCSLVCFSWRASGIILHPLISMKWILLIILFFFLCFRRKHLKPLFKNNGFRFSPKLFLAVVQIVNRCMIQRHTVFAFLFNRPLFLLQGCT